MRTFASFALSIHTTDPPWKTSRFLLTLNSSQPSTSFYSRWQLSSDGSKHLYFVAAHIGYFCACKSQYHDHPSGSGHRQHAIPNSHWWSKIEEQGDALDGQGLGSRLANMTVILAHRPKDQVEERQVSSKLCSPLPKGKLYAVFT